MINCCIAIRNSQLQSYQGSTFRTGGSPTPSARKPRCFVTGRALFTKVGKGSKWKGMELENERINHPCCCNWLRNPRPSISRLIPKLILPFLPSLSFFKCSLKFLSQKQNEEQKVNRGGVPYLLKGSAGQPIPFFHQQPTLPMVSRLEITHRQTGESHKLYQAV